MALQIQEPGVNPSPRSDAACKAVGIDLGTTHTLAAVVRDGQSQMIPLNGGGFLMPSVVGLKVGTKDQFVFGQEALALHQKGQAHIARSIKRFFTPERGPNETTQKPQHQDQKIWLGDQNFSPITLTTYLLRHVKATTEQALGHPLTEVVITVPAYFDEPARAATRNAAEAAGLSVLRLLSEPTAAALAYGIDENIDGLYGVYDLGGGTFDFSLLAIHDGVFDVRATGGDTQLGGDDVDKALATFLISNFKELPSSDQNAILLDCMRAKEALSNQSSVHVSLAGKRHTLTRNLMDGLTVPLMDRTIHCIHAVMKDAGVQAADLSGLILVGGATRMPQVRHTLSQAFHHTPLLAAHPDHVVSMGAGLQAKALTAGSDHLLLDVTPLSLGLETMGDMFEPLIHRNTRIPTRATQTFTTAKDNQAGLRIHVLQGEHAKASHNRSLAHFELSGIPPMPAGEARIEVTFQLDRDGLLTVSAREETTGVAQIVHVKPSHNLSLDVAKTLLSS
jgi:molecular chaperone HscA